MKYIILFFMNRIKKGCEYVEKVWIFMIIFSFVFAVCVGNVQEVVKSLFESTSTAIELCISIAGIMCMWSGFMNIAEKGGVVSSFSKLVTPITRLLFPELPKGSEASGHIAINMTANMLGLGNVATPMGIKAMEKLQELNKTPTRLSKSQLMFVVLNTASIQLIPTTVIAIRANLGSTNPNSIVFPTIVSSVISVIVGIILVNFVCRKDK